MFGHGRRITKTCCQNSGDMWILPVTGSPTRLAGEGEAGEHGAPAGDLYVSGSGEAARYLGVAATCTVSTYDLYFLTGGKGR